MVKYIKGDLFQASEEILAHGCNCIGGYGSGVAAGMAHNHRKARDQYLNKFQTDGWKLGDVQFVMSGIKVIANCATQQNTSYTGECVVDYNSIEVCLNKVKDFARRNKMSIAIPRIGAGLAGGDWNKIKTIIDNVFNDYDVTVYSL